MAMGKEVRVNRHHIQRGCIGCCVCEKGVRNVKRSVAKFFLIFCTGGFGLLILPFYKKCLYCGHSMFMNQHEHGGE